MAKKRRADEDPAITTNEDGTEDADPAATNDDADLASTKKVADRSIQNDLGWERVVKILKEDSPKFVKYDKQRGCFLSTRSTNDDGYVVVRRYTNEQLEKKLPGEKLDKNAGPKYYWHRMAHLAHYGRDPPRGTIVSHLCDNRNCFRPDHVREETQQVNVGRVHCKGAGILCVNGHLVKFEMDPPACPHDPPCFPDRKLRLQCNCPANTPKWSGPDAHLTLETYPFRNPAPPSLSTVTPATPAAPLAPRDPNSLTPAPKRPKQQQSILSAFSARAPAPKSTSAPSLLALRPPPPLSGAVLPPPPLLVNRPPPVFGGPPPVFGGPPPVFGGPRPPGLPLSRSAPALPSAPTPTPKTKKKKKS